MGEETGQAKAEGLSYGWLAVSIVASVLIWGWLFSFKMALVLVVAILIHEYGHYHWMGREGILKRKMIMIPPLGAVAYSKEPFPCYAAENRIALAGPGIGLIALFGFYLLLKITGQQLWAAAVVLTAYVNLFNLLIPVSILDGGRVIKSALFSLHDFLGKAFLAFGFALSLWFGFFISPVGFVLAFFVWEENKYFFIARKNIRVINKQLEALENEAGEEAEKSELARLKREWEKIAYPTLMTGREIATCLSVFALIIAIYFAALRAMHHYILFSPLNILDLLKYFN